MTKSLTGKVALVTGGSRGIGAASARALANEGANVAISYVASPDKAEAVVQGIESQRCRGESLQGRPGVLSRSRPVGEGRRKTFRPARHPRQQCRRRGRWRGRRSQQRYRGARPPGRDQCPRRDHGDPRGIAADGRRRTHHYHRFGHRHPRLVPGPRRLRRRQRLRSSATARAHRATSDRAASR